MLAGGIAAFFAILNWQEARSASSDVRRLAELTESSLEEARAQVPDPWVRFLIDSTATVEATVRGSSPKLIDKAKVVENEVAKHRARISTAKATERLNVLKFGLVTGTPQRTREERIEEYERALAGWLDHCEQYLQEIRHLVGATSSLGMRAECRPAAYWFGCGGEEDRTCE